MKTRSIKPLVFSGLLLVVPVAVWWAFGLTLNHTPSVPTGIWYTVERAPAAPGVGTVVRTCLDDHTLDEYRSRGFLRWGIECNGSEALLKPVGAVAGDLYSVTPQGILINGKLVPNTAPLKEDTEGRALPMAGSGWLPPGYVLLIAESPTSLDSRYFGPVPVAHIKGSMAPLWTWR